VLPSNFTAGFYIARKAAKSDGAADAAQVTCACSGENGPFFGACWMLSFALPLAESCRVWGWNPRGKRFLQLLRAVTPTSALRRVKGCQEQTRDLLDTTVPPERKQIYVCCSLPGRPFMGDIFLLVCLTSPWRQHYAVVAARDKRSAISV